MAIGERQPIPAEATGVAPEVHEWAEEQVGLRKRPRTIIDNVGSSVIPGGHIRAVRGADVSGVTNESERILESLTREATWIEQQYEVRLPVVKETLVDFTADLPEGVMGYGRDKTHGNFNVTVVPQRIAEFDDPAIKATLDEEGVARVFVPKTAIGLVFEGNLQTTDGNELTPEVAMRTLRHALLGAGVTEEFLEENFVRVTEEIRRNRELALQILQGVPVEGIIINMKPRVEIDDIDKHRAIKVRRPKKRIIKPRSVLKRADAQEPVTSPVAAQSATSA